MGHLMRLIPFKEIMDWAFDEYNTQGSIFGVRKEKFYKNESGTSITMFGDKLSSALGPAAGPNSQLTQNIITSYLGGSRFIELKTVQLMDGEALRNCVGRPCINAEDECYNVEWSTELTVPEAYNEYVKAWFALHVISKELGLSKDRDFAFNMSVGYDLEGIKSEKIDSYIEGMKDASRTQVWKECMEYLTQNVGKFKNIDKAYVDSISPKVCSSITLSTLHGCPPAEIERIAKYLLEVKGVHTYIKCNPTLLGYEFARKTLDAMGYGYIVFDDHHFNDDLQYQDAVGLCERLKELAKNHDLEFGVKITNTFPVKIANNELPGEEMYMSGRSLFPLSVNVAKMLSNYFKGSLPISFSGGADYFNIKDIIATGIRPVTIATTILKPGGYERIGQIARECEGLLEREFTGIDLDKLNALADSSIKNKHHLKSARTVKSRKTSSKLGLYDCFKAPCKDGGCPIEQQIPEYINLVASGKYDEAFKIIVIDNANPAITGSICNHACQTKCTRLDYDSTLEIRNMKLLAALNAQDKFINSSEATTIKTDKKVAVIGAGPGGISTALFLRRNGVDTTVLEKRDKPFGIVSHVIPEFRISKDLIKKDYDMAVKTGVNFKFGVDENYNLVELKKEYDFIVLATGAWSEGISPVKSGGESIIDALKFLEQSKKAGCKLSLGKAVAVIGGGDVAMDCARAAKRAPGVDEVVVVYRRTKEFMPAEHEEIHLALEDNVKIAELLAPIGYSNGVLSCEVMNLGEKDASGRRGVVGTGKTLDMKFDTVIGAVGARVDTSLFIKNGLEVCDRANVKVTNANESTVKDVYIAGDCKKGPSTIVSAIADGKTIAKDILSKLGLEHDFIRVGVSQELESLYYKKGVLCESSKEAKDGNRCLSCDKLCEICCDVCPNRANVSISVGGFENKHQILHIDGMCNECGNCGVFCPHTGNPYKDKITLFWLEEDFLDSENKGFLQTGEKSFKIRAENGNIIDHVIGDGKVSKEYEEIINAVTSDYSRFIMDIKL